MNGHKNIWILKPGSLVFFGGEDITLHTDEESIFDHWKVNKNSPSNPHKRTKAIAAYNAQYEWIVQKYIENPLTSKKLAEKTSRKFDLRLWILVTDFDPLTVWFYEEFIIRLAMQDYEDDTLDIKKHLTNASIPMKELKKNKNTDYEKDDKKALEPYVKGSYEFVEEFGLDLWEQKAKPAIENMIRSVFEAVKENFKDHRHNTFEFFGLDVIIDDQFDSWLLEINRGPYMDAYSKTSRHVSEPGVPVLINRFVIEDTIKVLLDWENDKEADTGGWNLIT